MNATSSCMTFTIRADLEQDVWLDTYDIVCGWYDDKRDGLIDDEELAARIDAHPHITRGPDYVITEIDDGGDA